MQQIIQLDPNDDIPAIRAKVDAAQFAHVVLVVPRGCYLLQGISGMQLLRRAADDLGAQIAIVAHDAAVRDNAEEFGIPVFNSIAQAQRTRWRMHPPMRSIKFRSADIPTTPPERRPFAVTPELIREWRGAIGLIVVALGVLSVIAFFIAPTAQVRLIPSAVAMTVNAEIIVDSSIPDVNANTRSIPARRLNREISGTLSLKTTTTKSLPDARATGTVTFTNLRVEEITIPPGTMVKTSAGVPIRFTTLVTATLPAGLNSRVDASIQAVDPGPAGNVKELAINSIEGSLGLSVRVINTKPTVSGNVRPVKVVTADDKKKLEDMLVKQLQQQAPAVLRAALEQNEFVPPDSILVEVEDRQFDHAVDEPADALNLKITGNVFGLAVDDDDLDKLVRAMLEKQIQTGYQLLTSGVKADMMPGGKFQGIQLRQPIRAVGYTAPQIDPAKVARAVQGKSASEAKSYLASQLRLAQSPDIQVMPPGWWIMPWFAFRIAVFVEPQAVGQ